MKFRRKAVVLKALKRNVPERDGYPWVLFQPEKVTQGVYIHKNEIKEYYEPADAEAAAEWQRVYGEEYPPVSEKDSGSEMNRKVQEGIALALKTVTDPKLKGLCRSVLATWDHLMSQAIIVSVGLSAMRFRTPEQITEQLAWCDREFKKGVERSKCICAGNETEN